MELIKPTEQQFQEIADTLTSGLLVYFNVVTGVYIAMPDPEIYADDEFGDLYDEDRNELDNNVENYIVFREMDSYQAYKVMSSFVETIDDINLKNALLNALSQAKPFRKFKNILENSENYLKKWDAFRLQQYTKWVKEQYSFAIKEFTNE